MDPGRLVERALADAAPPTARCTCIAAGKAAHGMALAAVRALDRRVGDGVVIAPGPRGDNGRGPLPVIAAGHPTPDAGSERGGRRALELARAAQSGDQILVLLSGGASALMAAPAAGVTLADKATATDLLLKNGADIHELNTVRKHLSAVKGGWLAAVSRAPTMTLAISDVVGDDLAVIGSGPAVADPTTFADALAVLRRRGGVDAYPPSVGARLSSGARGEVEETPKPGDRRLARSAARVIGSRLDAMQGAADRARGLGYAVHIRTEPVVGEARVAARDWIALSATAASDRPVCLVSSGETTVRVTGSGRGGRNQEFALAVVDRLASPGRAAALASVGTDGIDGPTDAAGAIVDSTTAGRAAAAALSVADCLDNNDAYRYFDSLDDLVRTGPTGTNVGDLQILLLA